MRPVQQVTMVVVIVALIFEFSIADCGLAIEKSQIVNRKSQLTPR